MKNIPGKRTYAVVQYILRFGMWEILSQSSPFSFLHLCINWGQSMMRKEVRWLIPLESDVRLGQFPISRDCKEVRWLIPSRSDVRLSQDQILNVWREVRFLNHSSGRDSNSSIWYKHKCFNLERGGEKEEEEEEEEDGNEEALPPLLFISIVSSNAFKLLWIKVSCLSRFGNSGMQVILGQFFIHKKERRGKYGMCWW